MNEVREQLANVNTRLQIVNQRITPFQSQSNEKNYAQPDKQGQQTFVSEMTALLDYVGNILLDLNSNVAVLEEFCPDPKAIPAAQLSPKALLDSIRVGKAI